MFLPFRYMLHIVISGGYFSTLATPKVKCVSFLYYVCFALEEKIFIVIFIIFINCWLELKAMKLNVRLILTII